MDFVATTRHIGQKRRRRMLRLPGRSRAVVTQKLRTPLLPTGP
nr:MAG TPA: hypothetical protein [Siphoviridae sp. ctKRf14]